MKRNKVEIKKSNLNAAYQVVKPSNSNGYVD